MEMCAFPPLYPHFRLQISRRSKMRNIFSTFPGFSMLPFLRLAISAIHFLAASLSFSGMIFHLEKTLDRESASSAGIDSSFHLDPASHTVVEISYIIPNSGSTTLSCSPSFPFSPT